MEMAYQTSKLQKLCEDHKYAIRHLGPANATKLRNRLDDIEAADSVIHLIAGNPHPLKRERKGQLSISLAGGMRLIIKPNHNAGPEIDDGSVDWAAVTSVTVCFIGDYHD